MSLYLCHEQRIDGWGIGNCGLRIARRREKRVMKVMGIFVKKPSIKAIISSLLILIFLFLVFTGALMYFGKTGVVWGVSRYNLRAVHFWVAVSMCILIPVHFIVNFRLYRSELKALSKRAGKRERDNH